MKHKTELLAPVGNHEMLNTAIKAGADAIYFGIKGINMRASSKSFELEELESVVKLCKENNVETYLTLNTIIYNSELEKIKTILDEVKRVGISAVICWDLFILNEAKKRGIETHISTQASISNYETLKSYYQLGARRFVLARELKLEEVKEIYEMIQKDKLDAEIEIFGHGAMCVAVSGRCFMSQFAYNKSANRGECIQPCRRSYKIIDPETKVQFEIGNDYVMSPEDLCTLPFLDQIIPYARSIKIEGRGRSPEYVKMVIEAYREALDAIERNEYTDELKLKLNDKVKQVYNRDFSDGFYMNRPIKKFTDAYGSKATKQKVYAGVVKNYYKKAGAAEIKVEAHDINVGDKIFIIGPTTGVVEDSVKSIQIELKDVKVGPKGTSIAIITKELVRKNDKVYLWKDRFYHQK